MDPINHWNEVKKAREIRDLFCNKIKEMKEDKREILEGNVMITEISKGNVIRIDIENKHLYIDRETLGNLKKVLNQIK